MFLCRCDTAEADSGEHTFTGPSQGPSVSVGRPAAVGEVRNDLIKSDPLIPPTKMKTFLSIVCLDHYANALFVHLMACFASLSVG